MLAPKQNLPADQRRLLKLYKSLSEQDRESLTAFAEFLARRGAEVEADEGESTPPAEPKQIPRPEDESVVGAIRRLSETYFMLDKSVLFTETSSLMSAHLLQGRKAPDVIDELEALFETHYRKLHLDKE